VSVLTDACATVNEQNERIALDYLERVAGVELVRATERPSLLTQSAYDP
jgi:hypothetical protein